MKILDIKNFEKETQNKKVLVDFYAGWCSPCKAIAPKLEELSKEQSEVEIVKVNVDENPQLADQFGIRGIPTLILLDNGKVLGSLSGNVPKEDILKLIKGS